MSIPPSPFRGRKRLPSPSLDGKAIHIQREGRTRRGEKIPDYYIAQSDETGLMAITPTRDSAAQVVHLYRQPGEEVIDETGDGGPDPDGEFEGDEKAIRIQRDGGANKQRTQGNHRIVVRNDAEPGHYLAMVDEPALEDAREFAEGIATGWGEELIDETGTGEEEVIEGDEKAIRVYRTAGPNKQDSDTFIATQDTATGHVLDTSAGEYWLNARRHEASQLADQVMTSYVDETGTGEVEEEDGDDDAPGAEQPYGRKAVRVRNPDGDGYFYAQDAESGRVVSGHLPTTASREEVLRAATEYANERGHAVEDETLPAEGKSADLIEADTPDGKRYFTPAVPGEVKAVHVGRVARDDGDGLDYFMAATDPSTGQPVPDLSRRYESYGQMVNDWQQVDAEHGVQHGNTVDWTLGGDWQSHGDAVRDPQDAAEQDEVLGQGTHRNKDFHPRRPVPGDRVRVESHPSRHQQTSAALVRNFPDSVPESHRLRAQGNKVALDQSVFDHASEGTYELGDDGSHAVRESDGSVSTLGDDYPGTMYVLDEHGRKYPREQKDMSWLAGGRGEHLVPPAAQAPFARRRKSLQGKWNAQKGVELTAYAYAGPGLRSGGKSLTFHKGKSFTYHGKDVAWYDVKSSSAMGLEPHFTGVVKDRRGRTICFREGKRVQCPRNPKDDPKKRSSKPKPPAEQREPSAEAQVQQAHPRTPQEFGQEGFLIRRDTPVDNAALECEWYVLEGVFRTYQFYANPSLARLNAVIRAQGEMSPSDVSMHDRLQRAFAMSPLAAGQVYRGVDLTYSAELAQGLLDAANNSMATGQPMQLPGYTPCSTRPDAQFFSKIRMCLTVTGGLLMGPEEMLLNVDTFVTVSQVLETEYGWDIHAAEVVELDPESAIPGMDPGQVQPADAPPPTGQKAFRVPPERDPEDTVEFQGEEITNQELADRMNDPKSPAGEWAENQRLTISGRRVLRARGYIESDEEILARQRDAGEQQKALDPRVRAGSRVRVSPTQARAAAFNNAGPPITDEGLAMGARPVTDAEFVQNATNYGDVPADMPHPYLGGVNLRYDNSNQIGLLDPQDVDIDLHEAEFLPEEDGKALDPRVRVGSRVMTQPTQATAAADNQRSLDEYENAGDYEYHPTDADYVMNNRRGGQTVTAINPDQHFDVDTTGYHHTFQADVGASTASSTYDIIPEEEPKSLYSARRKALRRKWLSDFGKRLG